MLVPGGPASDLIVCLYTLWLKCCCRFVSGMRSSTKARISGVERTCMRARYFSPHAAHPSRPSFSGGGSPQNNSPFYVPVHRHSLRVFVLSSP